MFWDPDINCDFTKLVWTNLDKENSNPFDLNSDGFELQPHFTGIGKWFKNHGKYGKAQIFGYAKFGGEGEKIEAWGKLQRSDRKEKKEMKITHLNNQKNAWPFFCHMDYCKDELYKVSSPMGKLKLMHNIGVVGFGLLQLSCEGFSRNLPLLQRHWTHDDRFDHPNPKLPCLPDNRDVLLVDDHYHIALEAMEESSEDVVRHEPRVYSPLPRSLETPDSLMRDSSGDQHSFPGKRTSSEEPPVRPRYKRPSSTRPSSSKPSSSKRRKSSKRRGSSSE